ERIDHLEDLVADLHAVLLSRPDAPPISANGESAGQHAPSSKSAVTLMALPGGQSYHRAECRMVEGKREAKPSTSGAARRQGLKPCRLCEPQAASARAWRGSRGPERWGSGSHSSSPAWVPAAWTRWPAWAGC